MRFSYYVNPQTPGPEHDRRMLYEVLGQVDLAEKLGFADVWLTEHHFLRGFSHMSAPEVIFGAAAHATDESLSASASHSLPRPTTTPFVSPSVSPCSTA